MNNRKRTDIVNNVSFDVIAKDSYPKVVTRGKIYHVCSVFFSNFNPEGLFFIYSDRERWEKVSSIWFKPIKER